MAPHRNINRAGLELIKSSESFVPYVYDDLVPPVRGKYKKWTKRDDKGNPTPIRGTLTIGYGHTDSAKYSFGVALRDYTGPNISEAKASQILDVDLDECEEDVSRIVKVQLNDNQFAALVSFTFNCGSGNLKKLVSKLNSGVYEDIPPHLMLYTKSKGKELRGLVTRRRAEAALWRSLPEEAKASADLAAPHPIPEEVDAPPSTTSDWAGQVAGGGAALQAAASATTAAAEVKKNTGEIGLFSTLDYLASRPSFWIAVVVMGFVMWWTRWPSWLWRRFSSQPQVAK